jgi:HEAT repeat protein
MEELFQKGQEQALTDPLPVPDNEVRQIRELLQALIKTKRAFEMYPANNPILLKFQEDLVRRFDSFFEGDDRLTLIIRQYEIYYKGQQVYQNSEKEDNLALFFYKDGLRELTFTAGFGGDEITDFLDVIRSRPEASSESYDDDIVTLLWEKDFVHLRYYVVEEYTEGAALEDDEVARLLSNRPAGSGEVSEAYSDALKEEADQGKTGQEVFSPLESISMGFKGVFTLGEEEVKSLKEEMEGLTDENFLESAIFALFESLYLDRGTPDFNILMDNLDSAMNYLVYAGGFDTALLILKRFKEILNQKDLFSPKEVERIKLSIRKAGNEDRAKSIAELLNSGRDINSESLRLFLSQLDKSSVIPLSNLMGEIQDIKYRKVLIDALVILGRDNIEVLAAGLRDHRWFVVRNVAAILGRIGDKTSLEYLRQALHHPEPKVRREIVRSLGLVGGPKAGEILLHAVEDQDPQIRMAALRYLPTAHSHTVLDSLVEIITRPDFDERALSEKRVFFEVMAEIGQEKVLGFMGKLLRKKVLFGTAKNEEIRASAAYGLGNIHHNEALALLKGELGKSKKGGLLYEAISYSVSKLTGPSGRNTEMAE